MLSERATRALNRGTTSGVLGLAVAGFTMSYDALHSLAVEHGVPGPLAWMWPLVVDGFIIIASLSVVRAVADGRRALYPWVLVLAFSAISVTFNIVHAAPTAVARFVAAIPPTALVLSFELLMRQLRHQLNTNPAPGRGSLDLLCGSIPITTPAPIASSSTSQPVTGFELGGHRYFEQSKPFLSLSRPLKRRPARAGQM